MKIIVWLCNVPFTNEGTSGTGSWLQPMAEQLHLSGKIQIINITTGNVKDITESEVRGIKQFIIPKRKASRYNQLANIETCKEVESILNKIQPDLVHIWGTESIWASIYAKGFIKQKAILDIQGLLFAYTAYYLGGLSVKEFFKTIGIKEILMPWRNLLQKQKVFKLRGREEIKNLEKFSYISYQSDWVLHQLSELNFLPSFHKTKIMLRKNFYNAPAWHYRPISDPIIFTSASAAVSYKGLHTLLKAVALLKKKFPNIKLRIAGQVDVGHLMMDGYSVFLRKLIIKSGLKGNVEYVGSLTANEVVNELLGCNVCVVPSYVETYCLAFAEAMMLGVPTVTSYAGAMPELAIHGEEALFYNSIDYRTCAAYIETLILNRDLAEKISKAGRQRRIIENDRKVVLETQLKIYSEVLND